MLFDIEEDFKNRGSYAARCSRYVRNKFYHWLAGHRTIQDVIQSVLKLKELTDVLLSIIGGSGVVAGAVAGTAVALYCSQGAE